MSDWIRVLKIVLTFPSLQKESEDGDNLSVEDLSFDINYSNESSILLGLMNGTIYPDLYIKRSSKNNNNFDENVKISLPELFSVNLNENCVSFARILIVLQYEVFSITPLSFQKSLLDLLYLIMRREIYDVVRFKYSIESETTGAYFDILRSNDPERFEDNKINQKRGIVHTLIELLQKYREKNTLAHLQITKRIILLLGIICETGISVADLKCYLSLLKHRSDLTVSLLQGLKKMIRQDSSISKALLSCYFDFSGPNSGLTQTSKSAPSSYILQKEYHFCTWFRVENFEEDLLTLNILDRDNSNSSIEINRSQSPENSASFKKGKFISDHKQHIMTCLTSGGRGIDVFIDRRILSISIHQIAKQTEPTIIRFAEFPLKNGTWYHLSIKHIKPKLSIFSKDELVVHLDYQLLFQDHIKFPHFGDSNDTELSFGKNFDGQMGPIYLFSEAQSPAVVESIGKLDAGRPVDGFENSVNIVAVDLLHSIVTSSDRKVNPIMNKITSVYHPSRCTRGYALDIHSGRHATLGHGTRSCVITSVKDALSALGGISCLLPLFAQLLLSNDVYHKLLKGGAVISSFTSTCVQFDSVRKNILKESFEVPFHGINDSPKHTINIISTSLSELDWDETESYLEYSSLSAMKNEMEEYEGEHSLGLLFTILAKCIASHKIFKQDLVKLGAIEMIEHILSISLPDILQLEGESCVLALMQLKSAAKDNNSLETRITKYLLCNFAIWSKASFVFLNSLMSVVVAAFRAQPSMFFQILGMDILIDSLLYFLPSNEFVETRNSNDLNTNIRDSLKSQEETRRRESSDTLISWQFEDELREAKNEYDFDENEGDKNISEQSFQTMSKLTIDTSDNFDSTFESQDALLLDDNLPSDLQLNVDQKKHIRSCLQTMIMMLCKEGQSDQEIITLSDYMSVCKNSTILNEITEILLLFVVDGDVRLITSMIYAFQGVEEFTSFVLVSIINKSSEELRCTGIRLISLFYTKLYLVNQTALNLSLRKGKSRISILSSLNGSSSQGFQRFHNNGGLALLFEILNTYSPYSTEITYVTLRELLLTKTGAKSQISVHYNDLFDGTTSTNNNTRGRTASVESIAPKAKLSLSDIKSSSRSFTFTAHDLSPQHMDDENDEDMINILILPIFFGLLPKVPIQYQGLIYTDLLGLLKHSIGNRKAFCASSSLHNCMYGLLSQITVYKDRYVTLINSYTPGSIISEIESLNGGTIFEKVEIPQPKVNEVKKEDLQSYDPQYDLWYPIGMKIYATLLLHSLSSEGGWRDMDKCISLSVDNEIGYIVAQTVLSYTLNELSFNIRSRYKELQRLEKSNHVSDNREFKDTLENILSVLIASSHLTLIDQHVITCGIQDYNLCKTRMVYFDELTKKYLDKVDTNNEYDSILSKSFVDKTELYIKSLLDESENNELDINLNFSQTYWDLSDLPNSPTNCSKEDNLSPNEFKKRGSSNLFQTTELLNPLERYNDPVEGKLVVVLQTLRIFDAIFWPYEDGPIINTEILGFKKDSILNDMLRKESNTFVPVKSMSTFSCAMRMSFYLLNIMCPLSYTSITNLKRIKALMKATNILVQYNIPINEWVLATFLKITINVCRLKNIVNNVIKSLGYPDPINCEVKAVGPWDDAELLSDEKNKLKKFLFEKLMKNTEVTNKLQKYFENTPGRNILRQIRYSFLILLDMHEFHYGRIIGALDSKTSVSFLKFIEELKNSTSGLSQSLFNETSSSNDERSDGGETMKKTVPFSIKDPNILENPLQNVDNDSHQTKTTYQYEESFTGADILTDLNHLISEYFLLNPYRNIGLLKAIDLLDKGESEATLIIKHENKLIKQSLEEHCNFSVKLFTEITELKELNSIIEHFIKSRRSKKHSNLKIGMNIKNRNVLYQWSECLQLYQSDWSPYFTKDKNSSLEGYSTHEISQYQDYSMRNILIRKLTSPINHNNAAYFDGKLKDQLDFEARNVKSSIPSANIPDMNVQYKMNLKKNEDNWNDEDDIEDITVDNTVVKSENTIGIANMFFSGQGKRPQWSFAFRWFSDEKFVFISDTTYINIFRTVTGSILLTNRCIYFHGRFLSGKNQTLVNLRWHLDQLVGVYSRRYLLQNCAVELFFADMPEAFLSFSSRAELLKFFRFLKRQSPPQLKTPKSLNPRILYTNSVWTELWRRRLISNFEYIMHLNILGGRSYNDITQYPVFPWILADYKSPVLDLSDASTFRPLNKPIGALNPSRLAEIRERYRSFDDDTVPKFMYGSHYSSAGVVMHYLIRLEPFSTLAINLQGGRFDCPDRIFFDINRTWQGCNESMSDVKELVPELFTTPEILLNLNKLPLGELQEGGIVGDVILPPWASNAYEFIRLHREALESDYVSEHLNEWIDLIFGSKQTGNAALLADNLFYYLTYENAVDIESIEDPLQREATKAQVTHFGQTPSQLLLKDHPKRLSKEECMMPLCSSKESMKNMRLFNALKQSSNGTNSSIISIKCSSDKLFIVFSDLNISIFRWSAFYDIEGNPFSIRSDRSKVLHSSHLSCSEEILRGRGYLDSSNKTSHMALVERTLLGGIFSNGNTPKASLNKAARSNLKEIDSESPFSILSNIRSTFFKSDSSNITKSSNDFTTSSTTKPSLLHGSSFSSSRASLIDSMTNLNVSLSIGDNGSCRLCTCGFWDETLKIYSLDSMKEIVSINNPHFGQVTCVQQSGQFIVTGGADGTVRVWNCEQKQSSQGPAIAVSIAQDNFFGENISNEDFTSIQESSSYSIQCLHILCGHQSSIISLSYNNELDLIVSGGREGMICLHSARKGKYIRTIDMLLGKPIDLLFLSSAGYIIAHSWEDFQMHLFWINGQHMTSIQFGKKVECIIGCSASTNMFVCGTDDGIISFRQLWNLEETYKLHDKQHGSVKSLLFSDDYQFLFVGYEDGSLSVVADSENRMRLLSAAIQKNPLL